MLSEAERSIRGRIGAYSLHASRDPYQTTSAARSAASTNRDRRLLEEIERAGPLPAAERERRLEAARKAHFARLALKSARVRRRKKDRQLTDARSENQRA